MKSATITAVLFLAVFALEQTVVTSIKSKTGQVCTISSYIGTDQKPTCFYNHLGKGKIIVKFV